MSDAPHVLPVAPDPVSAEVVSCSLGTDGLASLVGRVRDTAARAAAAAGRVRPEPRGPAVRDATHVELAAARGQLCDAVGVLAARLRRDGLPPQRMLVVVKDAVRAAAPTAAEALVAREVMDDAVRCGIAAYYAVA